RLALGPRARGSVALTPPAPVGSVRLLDQRPGAERPGALAADRFLPARALCGSRRYGRSDPGRQTSRADQPVWTERAAVLRRAAGLGHRSVSRAGARRASANRRTAGIDRIR